MQKKLLGNEHPSVASSLSNLAGLLRDEGKLGEAEGSFREALAIRRKLFGNDSAAVTNSLRHLAMILEKEGKLSEARALTGNGLMPATENK